MKKNVIYLVCLSLVILFLVACGANGAGRGDMGGIDQMGAGELDGNGIADDEDGDFNIPASATYIRATTPHAGEQEFGEVQHDDDERIIIWRLTASDFIAQSLTAIDFGMYLVDSNGEDKYLWSGVFRFPNGSEVRPFLSFPSSVSLTYAILFGIIYPMEHIDLLNPQIKVYGPRNEDAVVEFIPTNSNIDLPISYRFEIHIVASYE